MTTDDYNFAATYMRYYAPYVEFDADLDRLVGFIESGEDYGDLAGGSFYRLTPDGWVELDDKADIEPIRQAREEAQKLARAAQAERSNEKPWQLWVEGPDGTKSYESSHATEAEAQRAATQLPAALVSQIRHATR